jgi:hypothetical protein
MLWKMEVVKAEESKKKMEEEKDGNGQVGSSSF